MGPGVGLKSTHEVTVPTKGPAQLADYIYGLALGVGWAFVRPRRSRLFTPIRIRG
jgi:hypothetical protein